MTVANAAQPHDRQRLGHLPNTVYTGEGKTSGTSTLKQAFQSSSRRMVQICMFETVLGDQTLSHLLVPIVGLAG